jgi:DHA2 family multidrug resistance protein
VFYINVPVGALALLLVQTFVEEPPYIRHARAKRVDWIGFLLLALWATSLHLMLDRGQEEDWFSSPFIRTLLVLSVVTLPVLVLWELRQAEPILNLRILRNRNFMTGSALIAVVGAILYGSTTLLPLFLQTLLGYSAFQSGLAISPRGMGSFVAMFLVGRLVGKFSSRAMLVGGFLALAYSVYTLGNLNLAIAPIDVVWPNIINGLAMGFIFVPLTTNTMGTLRNEEIANATSIFNFMRNIGAAVGIAMMTTCLARGAQIHQTYLVAHLTPYDPAYRHALQGLQAVLAPHCGAAAGQKAQAILGAQMARQAGLWAYVDDFRLLAILALACIPAVFLFRRLQHSVDPHSADLG